MEDIRIHLVDLLSEVSIFPSKDLLVNVLNNKCIHFDEAGMPNNEILQSILRESRATERKTGVSPLCLAYGVYKHKLNGNEIETPLFLRNVEPNLTNTKILQFESTGALELNPFIKTLLRDEQSLIHINSFEQLIRTALIDEEKLDNSRVLLGNFDPKRFAFIREIKCLLEKENSYSSALMEIYGNEVESTVTIKQKENGLFQLDSAQGKLIEAINKQSTLIQGPPGTGKSQVLSNFLGQVLFNQKSALVISEKHAAIDILCSKLDSLDLAPLYFKIPSKNSNKACVEALKASWEKLDSSSLFFNKQCFKNLKENRDKFNLIKKVANKENCALLTLIETIERPTETYKEEVLTNNITFDDLNGIHDAWSSIPRGNGKLLKHLKKEGVEMGFNPLEKEVQKAISVLKALKNIKNWNDAKKHLAKSLAYHSFMSEPYTTYGKHLVLKADFFLKHQSEYQKLKRKLIVLNEHEHHWKNAPTKDELDFLNDRYIHKKGFISSISWWSTWRKYTRTPQLDPIEQIKRRNTYFKVLKKLKAIEEKLYSAGIENIEIELPIISKLINSTNLDVWSEFQKEDTTVDHKNIYNCLSSIKRNFKFSDEDQPLQFLESFIGNKNFFLEHWSSIQKIPPHLFPMWNDDLPYFVSTVKASLKRRILMEHPVLYGFSKKKLFEETKVVNNEFSSEATKLSQNIIHLWSAAFKNLDALTRKDPRKLSPEEKDFRKKLKKGRSILTKEFAKKRSHKPIRELLCSEAKPWIEVLKPIWLGNPSLLADHLPMEKEMFDFVVSDESSQLLLSHSIGAFQRGKKSVICGDPKQMVPSSYFKKKQVIEMSLLQHAFYHLPKVFLSNHYRSKHPRLIAFSNANFYQNRLKSFQNTKAMEDPIEHHLVAGGVYHERKNEKEANAVAQKIKIEIDNKLKIGIVAFSETQLQLIHECLESETRVKLNKRIEEKSAFAHSLENVQGDECDLLFISMGYGFNKEKKFEMRFGPVNVHGGHHRLNVLFSRAKEKIDFFSSVELKDFSQSNNEGVRHLMKWFELMNEKSAHSQPNENVKFDEIIRLSDGFDDILSYTNVYLNGGYSIHL